MTQLLKSKTNLFITILIGWQALFAVAAAAAGVYVLSLPRVELAPWLTTVGVVLLWLIAAGSAVAVPFLVRRAPQGRILALATNYLGFLLGLLACFQSLKLFLGIDAMTKTFGKGIIFFLGIFVGYFISTIGDRFPNNYQKERLFRRAGGIVSAIFAVIFIWRIDFIPWLLTVLVDLRALPNLLLLLSTLLMGAAAWLMTQSALADKFHATSTQDEGISGYLFLSPNLLGFLLFFAAPLLLSLYVSFTDWDAFGTKNWIGLDNYKTIFTVTIKPLESMEQSVTEALDSTVYDELTRFKLFGRGFIVGAKDKLFWLALRNTLLFCLLAVPLGIIPALLLANVLNSKIPGVKFFRALYFLPSIAAVVGVALIWQWLYNATIGYINYAITSGVNLLNLLPGMALVDPQIRWLSDGKTALLAIIIMSAWQTLGFNSVLFLAGLQNIPGEIYEAATVDGAGTLARFFKITLPMLAPTTFFVVSTTTIQALQVFEQVYIATASPGGGPNNATLTVVLYLYQSGFQRFKQGYASATAWVLFAIIFLITMFQFQRQRRAEAAYK